MKKIILSLLILFIFITDCFAISNGENNYTLPSFANLSFEYSINGKYEIYDSKQVIDNYEIKSSNIESYISNNRVYINTKEEGDFEIVFVRKDLEENSLNKLDEFKVNLIVSSGSITINKLDNENIDREFATLEGAKYGVYKDNELITEIKTDENGVAFVDNIPWGKFYTIKELETSRGYKIDEKSYKLHLHQYNKNGVVNSYSKVIKGNVIINNYYGEIDNYQLEDGSIFEIYDIHDKLIENCETKEGIVNVELEYGSYYVIQTNTKLGYKSIDKINMDITEEKDYIFDLYNDKEEVLIVEVPDTKKYDYNIFISILCILIGIFLIIRSLKKTTH